MSVSSLKTLRDVIKRRAFDGAYYISGEDDYQKDDAVRQLIDTALDPASRDFNLDVRRGAELDAEEAEVLRQSPRLIDVTERPGAKILDAPLCYQCGSKMQPAGSCYVCSSCGSTSGCS